MSARKRTSVAIMQPTYLPWAGYFNLIAACDVFVFLDDAQFQSSTYDQRNRILRRGRPTWLTVPIRHTGRFQRYLEVHTDESKDWRNSHYRLLADAYAGHPHYCDVLPTAYRIRDTRAQILSDITIGLIEDLARRLRFRPQFVRSSRLGVEGRRGQRVAAICRRLDCGEYLSPAGARSYLADDSFPSEISLRFQDVQLKPYVQPGVRGFISHLSIVDAIANLGLEGARNYIMASAGFRP